MPERGTGSAIVAAVLYGLVVYEGKSRKPTRVVVAFPHQTDADQFAVQERLDDYTVVPLGFLTTDMPLAFFRDFGRAGSTGHPLGRGCTRHPGWWALDDPFGVVGDRHPPAGAPFHLSSVLSSFVKENRHARKHSQPRICAGACRR